MIDLSRYKNKTFAVFGLGKTGLSVACNLARCQAKVYAWDDHKHDVSLHGVILAHPSTYDWSVIDALILSPGIPLHYPSPHYVVQMARKAEKVIISDIELLYLAKQEATFIGITGTNGKSTTTALIAHILQKESGGNIGTPVLELSDSDTYVLELSSFQLDLLHKTVFDIAVLLNITPDHLDRHGSFSNYIEAKKRILQGNKTTVIGIDNQITREIYHTLSSSNKVIPISQETILNNGVAVIDNLLYYKGEKIAELPQLHTTAENIAAAYAVSRELYVSHKEIISHIVSFKSLPHRRECVRTIDKITFINDSKATNAVSCIQVLQKYENIYWIAGGQLKEKKELALLSKYCNKITHAFFIGEAKKLFYHAFQQLINCTVCNDLKNATELAYEKAKRSGAQGVILLSPACASFDEWDNFAQRGEYFKDLVNSFT